MASRHVMRHENRSWTRVTAVHATLAVVAIVAADTASACNPKIEWADAGVVERVERDSLRAVRCDPRGIITLSREDLVGKPARREPGGGLWIAELNALVPGSNVVTSDRAGTEISCRESREQFASTGHSVGMGHGGCE